MSIFMVIVIQILYFNIRVYQYMATQISTNDIFLQPNQYIPISMLVFPLLFILLPLTIV